jgi:transcription elongation factor GreA
MLKMSHLGGYSMNNESGDISLGEAAGNYLSGLKTEERGINQQEVNRLVRWFGSDRIFANIAAYEVEQYAEQISPLSTDYLKKVQAVKGFLNRARKSGWTKTNLSVSIKIKKTKNGTNNKSRQRETTRTTLTPEGYAELKSEINELKQRRLKVIEDIRRAAEDKDFRENAPLQAAREERGHIEGRLMDLEETLKGAEIVEESRQDKQKISVGSKIVLCELDSGEEWCYVLVSPREVDPTAGKISHASPVGRSVLGHYEGEKVVVQTPAGKMNCLIKQVG